MASLPIIPQVLAAIQRANSQHTLSDKELHLLMQVLKALYDKQLQHAYKARANEYAELADNGGDLQQDIVIALANLSSGTADEIVVDLISYFDRDPQFYELAHALVALVFPTAPRVGQPAVNLNTQKAVLAALLRNDAIWHADLTFRERLAAYHLPTDRAGIAKQMNASKIEWS